MRQMSRRKLLGKGAQAVVAGGIAFSQIPALEARAASKPSKSEAAVDYYQKLGVTPFINAAGTYTVLSASTMSGQHQAAIDLAAKQPVNLNELIEASGAYLAIQSGSESGLVTGVAAAPMVMGTAACVTLGNEQSILA